MAEPYLGEIRLMSFGSTPEGWAPCDGTIYQIAQHQALFALLGVSYGGDGQTTFALPDLRGRVPIGSDGRSSYVRGQHGGEESHTLTVAELPPHLHLVRASSDDKGQVDNPTNNFLGAGSNLYHVAESMTPMNPGTVAAAGGGGAHANMQPFLALQFCIAVEGTYPDVD